MPKRTRTALRVSPPEVLYGWEPRTCYVPVEDMTRGQAKALVAYEVGEPFTALRCRRIWLHEREITEDDALFINMDDWYEGVVAWIECRLTDKGAIAWWEITWPR